MRVVCIGGGQGLASTLSAWVQLGVRPTAIVATTDNGGSSGRLRRDGSPVPWGDLRKAITALAPSEHELLSTLSQRYAGMQSLAGHCFGNLLLEAYFQQSGGVVSAVNQLAEQLGCFGSVLPMSESSVDLMAVTHQGKCIFGETAIDALPAMPVQLLLSHPVSAPQSVIQSILTADLICLGPGSVLTSIMPALLMHDIQQALLQTKAATLFIHNIAEENSPVATVTPDGVMRWIANALNGLTIDAELNKTHVTIGGRRNTLPVPIQARNQSGQCRHQVQSLSEALAFCTEKLTPTYSSDNEYTCATLSEMSQRIIQD